MKTVMCLAVIAFSLSLFAQDDGPKLASLQRDQCASYINPPRERQPIQWGNICVAYARGVQDEMDGEIQWTDNSRKAVFVGRWQGGITTDQLVRVFLDYLDKNPAQLNKPARDVIRQSAEAANIYTYSPAP